MGSPKHSLFFGITARSFMIIAAGLLLVSYMSMFINPAKAWFMTIFGLLFLPLLLLNIFLFVWALFRRSRAVVIPLVALIPTFMLLGRFFKAGSPSADDGKGIKVVSYNVGQFTQAKDGKYGPWRACSDSVMRFLQKENADIICLQEVLLDKSVSPKEYFARYFKDYDVQYYVKTIYGAYHGNVTLSRYPATCKGRIGFENSANIAFYSEYNIGGDNVRVYNCHFQSYGISLSRLATMLGNGYKEAVSDTEQKMKRAIIRRPKQVDEVLKDIEACPEKVIVAGDFNDNPMSYTYRRLRRNRRDSFEEAGSGFGASFSRFYPLLRIDYILFPEEYDASYHNVMHVDYSDHYPIETRIRKEY